MKAFFLLISIISIVIVLITSVCHFSDLNFCSPLKDLRVYLGSAAIQLALISLALFFLWKSDLRTTLASVGFPGDPKAVFIHTIICLVVMFVVLFIFGILSITFGFNDQYKISDKIAKLPIPILILAALCAPICEELFFRGFLTQRIGVIFSAFVFGLLHFAYGSIVEVIGALLIGVVLGATFKITRNITPCILAHMVYNILAITFMRLIS